MIELVGKDVKISIIYSMCSRKKRKTWVWEYDEEINGKHKDDPKWISRGKYMR